jgi:hypothetical protein
LIYLFYGKAEHLRRIQWTFPFVAYTFKVDARITFFRTDIEQRRLEQAGHHEFQGERVVEMKPHIVLLWRP